MTDQSALIAKTILSHLKSSNQLSLLPSVVDALRGSPEYQSSHTRVVLTSAAPLDDSQLKGVKSYLAKVAGQSYTLVKLIDPDLLAGFTLQLNDTFIDASVIGKINTVQNKLTAKD